MLKIILSKKNKRKISYYNKNFKINGLKEIRLKKKNLESFFFDKKILQSGKKLKNFNSVFFHKKIEKKNEKEHTFSSFFLFLFLNFGIPKFKKIWLKAVSCEYLNQFFLVFLIIKFESKKTLREVIKIFFHLFLQRKKTDLFFKEYFRCQILFFKKIHLFFNLPKSRRLGGGSRTFFVINQIFLKIIWNVFSKISWNIKSFCGIIFKEIWFSPNLNSICDLILDLLKKKSWVKNGEIRYLLFSILPNYNFLKCFPFLGCLKTLINLTTEFGFFSFKKHFLENKSHRQVYSTSQTFINKQSFQNLRISVTKTLI